MNRPRHYETHLTLAADDPGPLDALRAWAESCGLKWTQIVLDRGRTPLQPMITFWDRGTLADQHDRARRLTREIAARAARVVRVKIEASVANDDVPQTDAEIPPGSTSYFEHHVKVVLGDAARIEELGALAVRHAARLSRNARRVRSDGRCERFVTQRVARRGAETARERLDRLLCELRTTQFDVLDVEAEYVLFDSAIELDAGWLELSEGD
jgi:hypothetical protein